MSLQRTPAWEISGPSCLPDYQKRSRRWELFRGRNLSARQADQRRLLVRTVAALLSLATCAAVALAVPRLPSPSVAEPSVAVAVLPEPVRTAESVQAPVPEPKDDQIHWKTVVATAYCPLCRVCETTGVTYTGREAIPDGVAVARRGPRAARLGTKLLVPGRGWLLVDDVGGGVESNQIDIRVSTHSEAVQFGRRQMRVGIKEIARG
jgi:3D (Asp-Asp-Asp) domain-containing protein